MSLRNYVHQLAKDVARGTGRELVVFIDTNPALSIYTQIALVAMTHLIIPVNADSFSMQVGGEARFSPASDAPSGTCGALQPLVT